MAGILKSIAAPLLIAMAVTPLPAAGPFEAEMLTAHNLVRGSVPVPSLAWSGRLAAVARRWADYLLASGRFEHQSNGPYGENLFEVRGHEFDPMDVVAAWAEELIGYDYRTNTCRGKCGHYTQLVWRGTREVGCASVRAGRRQVVVCEYDPPGNWRGQWPW